MNGHKCVYLCAAPESEPVVKELKSKMQAIIEACGKQYKVAEGDVIFMEKLGVEAEETVTFDKVLAIEKCWLQDDISNRIRNAVRDYAYEHDYSFINLRTQEGMLRNMIIRTSSTGELIVIFICKIT